MCVCVCVCVFLFSAGHRVGSLVTDSLVRVMVHFSFLFSHTNLRNFTSSQFSRNGNTFLPQTKKVKPVNVCVYKHLKPCKYYIV